MPRSLFAVAIAASTISAVLSGQSTTYTAQLRWTAGTLGSDTEFQQIFTGAVGPGRIFAVPDVRAFTVILIDSAGHKKRVIGRFGSGPGEFQSPGSVGFKGDTLWVSDRTNSRLTLFSLSGNVIRTIPLFQQGSGDAATAVSAVTGLLANGSMVGAPGGRILGEGNSLDPNARRSILWATREGVFRDTLFTYRGGSDTFSPRPGFFMGFQPFNDGDLWRVDPAGRWVVLIDRSVPVVGAKPAFRVTTIDTKGKRLTRAIPYVPVVLTKSQKDAAVDSAMKLTNRRPPLTEEDAVRKALYLPDYLPTVTALIIDDRDGSLWLRRENVPGATVIVWDLMTVGAFSGSVKLPSTETIVAARFPFIWVSAKGQDDEPLIRLYELKLTK